MIMIKLPIMLLVFLTYFALMHGQKIEILEYRQEHSETTCMHGLLIGDKVGFKAHIDVSGDPKMKYVHFYIKKQTEEFPTVIYFNLQTNCTFNKSDCQKTNETFLVITIRINATKVYSGAVIYGKLFTSNSKEIDSEHHTFPNIYDPTDIAKSLKVNGKTISTNDNNCASSVDERYINIIFACESQVYPCFIEITSNASTESIKGNVYAEYNTVQNEILDLDVTIKYGACRQNRTAVTIMCKLKTEQKSPTDLSSVKDSKGKCEELSGWRLTQIMSIVTLTIFTVISWSLLYYYKLGLRWPWNIKCTKEKPNKKDDQANELIPLTQSKSNTKYPTEYKCINNPYYTYYPDNEFTNHHIATKYKSDELYNLIQGLAKLTVSVLVDIESKDRCNVTDPSAEMSPNFQLKNNNNFRHKTGMIICVDSEMYDSNCSCQNCTNSCAKSNKWGKVFVLTSSTVVYDKNEAQKSRFNLFHDSHSEEAVTLNGNLISEFNVRGGWCIVECVTCNLKLLETLKNILKDCSDKMTELNKQFRPAGDDTKFVCIVSHPHDLPKQITVGYSIKRVLDDSKENIDYTRYQYTTPACYGSAGAFVYILGVSDITKKHFHVHLGSNVGYNYSSIGMEERPQ